MGGLIAEMDAIAAVEGNSLVARLYEKGVKDVVHSVTNMTRVPGTYMIIRILKWFGVRKNYSNLVI